ncbi:MAG TPA: hypothetical protein VEY70_13200 [Metabacillus sp.]|nr:hypothetical protein [Metabacillus sp.]
MPEIVRIIFLVLMSIAGLVASMNISTLSRSSQYLKEDLEIAVHDASIASLDLQQLSNGNIVFDPVSAEQVFRESFELNTGLEQTDYAVVDFKIFDESNSTFPVEYEPSHLDFRDTFTNPTIVAVIETTTNKYFFGAKQETVRRVAAYTYQVR